MITKKSLGCVKVNSGIRRTSTKAKSQKSSTISSMKGYTCEGNSQNTTFPVVRISDNHLLPGYSAVLTRSAEDGVGMEDLDQLQLDLEKLLSTTASRYRFLKSEMECLDEVEEKKKNKKFKPFEKVRIVFLLIGFSDFHYACAVFNSLIRECSQDTSVEIPHVGEHYTMDWSSDVLRYECDLNSQKQGSTKTVSVKKELKKSGLNAMVDTFSGPFSQRLIAALIEEKESAKANDELESSTRSGVKSKSCIHKKPKKEVNGDDIYDNVSSKAS
ncbi:hypothetical protein FQR65_LT09582 [Abscondita terminalis]|nr:hypothetical protein FQR65_LT09582 [Abscondita terminalis]